MDWPTATGHVAMIEALSNAEFLTTVVCVLVVFGILGAVLGEVESRVRRYMRKRLKRNKGG